MHNFSHYLMSNCTCQPEKKKINEIEAKDGPILDIVSYHYPFNHLLVCVINRISIINSSFKWPLRIVIMENFFEERNFWDHLRHTKRQTK